MSAGTTIVFEVVSTPQHLITHLLLSFFCKCIRLTYLQMLLLYTLWASNVLLTSSMCKYASDKRIKNHFFYTWMIWYYPKRAFWIWVHVWLATTEPCCDFLWLHCKGSTLHNCVEIAISWRAKLTKDVKYDKGDRILPPARYLPANLPC